MESIGIIRGFRNYTPQQLDQMGRDLKLSMSPQRLSYCASYYRNAARDPLIDEMKFLDCFISAQSSLVSSYAPVSLMTNDEFAARTYADMMQKRKTLAPNASYPCTLSEAFGLTTAYLAYAGKPSKYPHFDLLLENQKHSRRGSKPSAITASGAQYGLRLTKNGVTPSSVGDLLLLLLPDAGKPHTENGSLQKALLEDERLSGSILELTTVSEGGLLRTMLSLSDGLWIDMARLSRTGEQIPLSMLADGFVGYDIVRIPAPCFEAFYRTAKACGVSAMAFAQFTSGSSFTVSRGRLGAFTLESSFLRALVPIKTADVTLANESEYRPAKIHHTPVDKTSCKYLSDRSTPTEELCAVGETVVAMAATEPESGFFRNAVNCALVPVLSLAASGCAYTDIRLAAGLSLPLTLNDGKADLAPSLSAVMGLYRLLAELGIPLAERRLDTDTDAKNPHLTVFGVGKGQVIASSFAGASHYVHCITPPRGADGLPDFSALRAMLTELVGLNRSGKLVSARVLACESITDALAAMSSDTLGCRIENFDVVCADAPPVAILLESKVKLDAYYIGKTVERQIEKASDPIQTLPQTQYLLANDTNEILIVSHTSDADAEVLEKVLTERGGSVTRINACTIDHKALCHAILSARTLILCSNAELPNTPEVGFAIETFSRAGGWLLLTKSAKCGCSIPVIALEHGINDFIINQICK
jgi:hypothetical protein